ncbi:hypothetical protein N0V93_002262 [Gnomoniopsis smithogilvyi]|uniref:Rhodopsin domain-containing protein n=1 Tax=Gnomoniopsis smithogilvyi TaxID=1191159 RepID=A0A9W9CXI6_9PEZI|nr:hypothetical protein N0V93_002262 [Gnomoniopsis smithogilvyi]
MDLHNTLMGAAVARDTTREFIDPTARVNAGIWTLFFTATMFLGLRLWCKIDRKHGLWWDDYILIASWVVMFTDCIVISVEFATGYVSPHGWDDRMTILVSVSSVLTTVGQAWTKSAFAVTLLRPGITEGWRRAVLWFIVASLNVYMVITFFLQWTNYCGHSAEWWKLPGVCADYDSIVRIKTGRNMWNIITDFVLALFPWMVTWNMRIKRIEKIGICATMSLGVFVAAFSTWRTIYMMNPAVDDYNYGWFERQGLSMVWFIGEVAGTIIVQALPIIRHLGRDKTQQKTLVSMELNEVTNATTKIWSDAESSQDRDKFGMDSWKDLESGSKAVKASFTYKTTKSIVVNL